MVDQSDVILWTIIGIFGVLCVFGAGVMLGDKADLNVRRSKRNDDENKQ